MTLFFASNLGFGWSGAAAPIGGRGRLPLMGIGCFILMMLIP